MTSSQILASPPSDYQILKSASVIPEELVKALSSRAMHIIDQLRIDYFPEKSENNFLNDHFNKEGVFAKLASLRFASSDIFSDLNKYIIPLANSLYGEDDYYVHPIFYLRLSSPDFYQSDLQKAALLDSQPHFDRPFGLKAYTFWIPLETANQETGCLCDFSGPNSDEVYNHFITPWDEPNRYNYDSYLTVSPQIDSMLTKGINVPYVHIGDVLSFDWKVLHGATRPVSKRRLSFDYRLVPRRHFSDSPSRSVRVINDIAKSIDLCSAYNMISITDFKGASESFSLHIKKNPTSDISDLPLILERLKPDPTILEPLSPFSWRKEFSWVQ